MYRTGRTKDRIGWTKTGSSTNEPTKNIVVETARGQTPYASQSNSGKVFTLRIRAECMRVAFVCVETPHLAHSAQARRMRRTAELLAERGHEITVCCTRWWDGDHPTFEENDVTYRAVTARPSTERFAVALPFALRRIAPDVIHAGGWPAAVAISAATAGRTLGRSPVVVDWFGDEPASGSGAGSSTLRRSAARLPHRVLVPSRHVETQVRSLGTNEGAIRVIPESIDMGLVQDRTAVGPATIVTSRTLDEDANVETLLLALAELRNRDWQATVIGDGPERFRYVRQARDLRIEDRVSFPGALPLDERLSRYKAAHVFVQTAEWCPFASELLWALACGCVGIVDYQAESAAHELVEHRERGFLTTSGEELTDAIKSAGSIPHAEVNEEFAEYDDGAVLEQYLACYREVLGDGESGA